MISKTLSNNTGIIQLFPKTIYCSFETYSDTESLIKSLDTVATERRPMLEVDSSFTIGSLHQRSEFLNLTSVIMNHCATYAQQLGYSKRQTTQLKMQNMWFNRSDQNDFLFPHSHNGSAFSGAFYLKTASKNQIQFHNYNNTAMIPDCLNDYSFTMFSLDCVPNQLLIFPSDLIHSTPKQITKGQKLVISFNILFGT
jgi:uncharacterized protein (TIGR02466 family)